MGIKGSCMSLSHKDLPTHCVHNSLKFSLHLVAIALLRHHLFPPYHLDSLIQDVVPFSFPFEKEGGATAPLARAV